MATASFKSGLDSARAAITRMKSATDTTAGRAVLAIGWADVRKAHILGHPACFCCGYVPGKWARKIGASNDVHHVIPRHVAPDMTRDFTNLVTLCRKYDCHLRFGHFGDYRRLWNPEVRIMFESIGPRMASGEAIARGDVPLSRLTPPALAKAAKGRGKAKHLPPLGPVETDPVAQVSDADLHADLVAVRVGRRMHRSRLDRLIRRGLLERRVDMGAGPVVSLTRAGKLFFETRH